MMAPTAQAPSKHFHVLIIDCSSVVLNDTCGGRPKGARRQTDQRIHTPTAVRSNRAHPYRDLSDRYVGIVPMVTVVLNFRRLATFKLKEMAKAAGFDDRSEFA